MHKIIPFPKGSKSRSHARGPKSLAETQPANASPRSRDAKQTAQIIIFPGVRYERFALPLPDGKTAKSRKG